MGMKTWLLIASFIILSQSVRNRDPNFSANALQTHSPILIQTPTPHSTPTRIPSPSPTITPKPTLSPTQTPTQTPASIVNTFFNSHESYIFDAINDYRRANGVSDLTPETYSCNFAEIRAKEISQNFTHDGFNQRRESHALPYPSFSHITENISMNTNYKKVITNWIQSVGHAENLRSDTLFGCVQEFEKFYVFVSWKP